MLVLVAVLAAAAVLAALLSGRRPRAAARRYRLLTDHSPDVAVVLLDRTLRVTVFDGAAIERDGWSAAEVLGRRLDAIVPAERFAALRPLLEAGLRGEASTLEWQRVRSDAVYRIDLLPYRARGRAITHVMLARRDIGAERALRRTLEEQRGFLLGIMDRLAGQVNVCDADGGLLTFHAAQDPTVSRELHPLEWAEHFEMASPDGTALGPHEAPLLRALRGEEVSNVEIRSGGRELLCNGGPVTTPDGRPLGAVIVASNLAAHRETADRLRSSEERHRRVVESMVDCVFEVDERGRWSFLTEAWADGTGYAVEDSLGRLATDFVHPDDRAAHAGAFAPLLRGEQAVVRLRHRFQTAAGAIRWADVQAGAVTRWDGLPAGICGVIRDVTDEERARQHAAVEQAVIRLLAGALSLDEAAPGLLEALCRDLDWDGAELWRMGDDEHVRRTACATAPGVELPHFETAGARLAFEVGDGLVGQAWVAREPLWRADLVTAGDMTAGRRGEAAADGLCSRVALPLRADGATVGVALLVSRTPREPEPGLVRLLETIGAHIAQFLQRRDAEERLAAQAADLKTLSGVAHELAAQSDMYAARTTLCRAVRDVCGASCVVLWEAAAGGDELEVSAASGAAVHGMRLPLDADTPAGAAFVLGELTFVADFDGDPRVSERWREVTGAGCGAWIPVQQDERGVGVIAIGWAQRRPALPERETDLLRLLAAEAAVTIHRTDLLARLHETARTDALTGLPNRRVWDEDLAREIDRARRHGGSLCLAMIDLDHFKAFNDHHGHQAGDRLLAATSVAWLPELRATDTIARYGGEEFTVLLPHSDAEGARAVIDRLLAVVPLGQTASAGIAVWDGSEPAASLLARADAALYEAKGAGRAQSMMAA
jgi:diguanylate cyclase (GGDEF)-like protein/PAS domain S-box-containing protein